VFQEWVFVVGHYATKLADHQELLIWAPSRICEVGWRKPNRKPGLATLWEIELLFGHLGSSHTSAQNYIGLLLSPCWDRCDLLLKPGAFWTHVTGARCQGHLFSGWRTNSYFVYVRDILQETNGFFWGGGK
jgi:hypothetical protein